MARLCVCELQTINDVMMAVIALAVEQYIVEKHGTSLRPLVSMHHCGIGVGSSSCSCVTASVSHCHWDFMLTEKNRDPSCSCVTVPLKVHGSGLKIFVISTEAYGHTHAECAGGSSIRSTLFPCHATSLPWHNVPLQPPPRPCPQSPESPPWAWSTSGSPQAFRCVQCSQTPFVAVLAFVVVRPSEACWGEGAESWHRT